MKSASKEGYSNSKHHTSKQKVDYMRQGVCLRQGHHHNDGSERERVKSEFDMYSNRALNSLELEAQLIMSLVKRF